MSVNNTADTINLWRKAVNSIETSHFEHEKWLNVKSEVFVNLALGSTGQIISVIGPSHVGKTNAVRSAISQYKKFIGENDLLVIHVDFQVTRGPQSHKDKSIMFKVLAACGFPGTESIPELIGTQGSSPAYRKLSLTQMQECIKAIACQNPGMIMVFDEAQRLAEDHKYHSGAQDLAFIKELNDKYNVSPIVIGGYKTHRLFSTDSHSDSRASIIHFSPYSHIDQEFSQFSEVLSQIESMLPPRSENVLRDNFDLLWNISLGSIGLLVKIVRQAVRRAAAAGSTALTLKHFEGIKIESYSRETALQEYSLGEEHYGDLGFISQDERESLKRKKQDIHTGKAKQKIRRKSPIGKARQINSTLGIVR